MCTGGQSQSIVTRKKIRYKIFMTAVGHGLAVPPKLNTELPYFPAISLLGIYPRLSKTYPFKNLCKNSSVIHNCPKGKNPTVPPTDEWPNKNQIFSCNGIEFSRKKEWGTDRCCMWMHFENTMLTKESRKGSIYIVWYGWNSRWSKSTERESRLVVATAGGGGNIEWLLKGKRSLFDVIKTFWD